MNSPLRSALWNFRAAMPIFLRSTFFRKGLLYAGVILAVAFGCMEAAGQKGLRGWAWQNPLPQGNPLNAIHFAQDKKTGYAVGVGNTILKTRDGGFTWQRQYSPTDVNLPDVFVRDERNAVMVGVRGTILATDNGGGDWKPVPNEAREHLRAVTFAGDAREFGWAVGTGGRVVRSTDGGGTWAAVEQSEPHHLNAVSALDG